MRGARRTSRLRILKSRRRQPSIPLEIIEARQDTWGRTEDPIFGETAKRLLVSPSRIFPIMPPECQFEVAARGP